MNKKLLIVVTFESQPNKRGMFTSSFSSFHPVNPEHILHLQMCTHTDTRMVSKTHVTFLHVFFKAKFWQKLKCPAPNGTQCIFVEYMN